LISGILILLFLITPCFAQDDESLSDLFDNLVADVKVGCSDNYPVSTVLWVDGVRKQWTGDPEPFVLPDNLEHRYLEKSLRAICWRGFSSEGDTIREWQLKLSSDDKTYGLDLKNNRRLILRLGSRKTATGLEVIKSQLFKLPDTVGNPELELMIVSQDARVLEKKANARRALLLFGALGILLILPGVLRRSSPMLFAGLIVTRLVWRYEDLFQNFQQAWPTEDIASPTSLLSLVDPAYFATNKYGGFFSSSADALITAILIFGLFLAIGKWIISNRYKLHIGPEIFRELFFGLIATASLLFISDFIGEIVGNANARLIGVSVPLLFPTFWALHATMLLVGASFVALLVSIAAGFRKKFEKPFGLGAIISSVLMLLIFGNSIYSAGRLILLIMVWLMWVAPSLRPAKNIPLRRLSWTLPLLIAISWNYMNISGAYWRSGGKWLERKAVEITEPGYERAHFLIQNILSEVASYDVGATARSGGYDSDLWNDWPAFSLWKKAGLDQMNLPCRLDLIKHDGTVSSVFATGSLRDYGYEISNRSEWSNLKTIVSRPGVAREIHLQSETRIYPDGQQQVLRGEIGRRGGGWIGMEIITDSSRLSTLRSRIGVGKKQNPVNGYSPRQEIDSDLLLLRGTPDHWLATGSHSVPEKMSSEVIGRLQSRELDWGYVWVDGKKYRSVWAQQDESEFGYLLGVEQLRLRDRILDMSRLILLDLILLAIFSVSAFPLLLINKKLPGLKLGFQERFLVVYLVLGLLPLLLAGTFINRLSHDWLADEARDQVNQGLNAAEQQLRGLLAEQGRALASSAYISDLISSKVNDSRPLGPFEARQGMVFTADGNLLLDETLSDLDSDEAALLLKQAKASPLFLMQDPSGAFIGTVLPVDLSSLPETKTHNGYFIYRQLIDSDMVTGLGQIIQGEVTLHVDGVAMATSHPEQLFSGFTPMLLSPDVLNILRDNLGNHYLHQDNDSGMSWSGMLPIPVFNNDGSSLTLAKTPAVLTVTLPAREAEFLFQRDRTILFLAGLATLIFLTAMLLGLALTWQIFVPVRVLLDATRRLADGDYEAPLPAVRGDEVGMLSSSFGMMRDNLQSAQVQLADREKFLANLLATVPVGVAVFDIDGNTVSFNPAGLKILSLFDSSENSEKRLLEMFKNEVPHGEGEAEVASVDMSRTLRGRIAPLKLPEETGHTLLVYEDVTEFLSTKRMAINAELARQVAHEVKNPLTPIQLSVQFMQQAWRDNAENIDEIIESTAEQVLRQVGLLRTIATEFSLLGKPEELDCKPVDLLSIVNNATSGYMTADGVSLVKIKQDDLPKVIAHQDSLLKVLANLMENSLLSCDSRDDLKLKVDWEISNETVSIIWKDNGRGLAPGVAERLFEPYFSTRNEGTGLGLPICRSLLSKMGGAITIANRLETNGVVAKVTLRKASG
jgi:signal transduction histidine kinase